MVAHIAHAVPLENHATEVVVQITADHIVQDVTAEQDILDVAASMVSVLN